MAAETSLLHSVKSFKWSEQEYEPKEILDRFSHMLPIVIVVTQGHMGKDEGIHCLASDEMYYLHEVAYQPRVVVSDSNQKYFSIPLCYEEVVIPTKSNGQDGPEMTVKKMVESGVYRMFRFAHVSCHTVCRGADIDDFVRLGILEILDTYDERFLAVHTVMTSAARAPPIHFKQQDYIQDGLNPSFTLLPVYMPVAIAVALDLVDNANKRFYRTMLKFKRFADRQSHNYDPMLKDETEIMTFEERPSNGDYEYIHFLQFIKTNKEEENISPEGYWKVKDEDVPDKKPTLDPAPRGPAPVRPPKSDAVSKKSERSKYGIFSKLIPKKKKIDKNAPPPPLPHKPELPQRVPTPVPETDSDEDYEEIPDEAKEFPNNKPYSNIEFTPLKDRTGPVALGLDPESVLAELHKVMIDGFIPGYENFECDLNPKLPPTPPPEPEHLRPQRPSREPLKMKKHSADMFHPIVPSRPDSERELTSDDIPRPTRTGLSTQGDRHNPPLPTKRPGQNKLPLSDENDIETAKNNLKATPRGVNITKPSVTDKPKPQATTSHWVQKPSSDQTQLTSGAGKFKPIMPDRDTEPQTDNWSTSNRQKNVTGPKPTSDRQGRPRDAPVPASPATQASTRPKAKQDSGPVPASAAAATPGASEGLSEGVTSVSQIPLDLSSFTVNDVAECLKLLNMADFAPIFVDNQIDGQFLYCLDQEVLEKDFNFDKLKAMKLVKFISGWRPKI